MASSSIRDGGNLLLFTSNILKEATRHRPWHCQRLAWEQDRIGGGVQATWVLINALKTKRPPSGLPSLFPDPHGLLPWTPHGRRGVPPAAGNGMRSNRPQSLVKFNWRNFSSAAPRDPIWRILLGFCWSWSGCCYCCRLLLLWALAIVLDSGSL